MSDNHNNQDDFFDYDNYLNKSKKKKTSSKKAKKQKAEAVDNDADSKRYLKFEGYESIESIKKMFDAALSEDDDEINEITFEESEPEPPPENNPEGMRSKLLYILGVAVTLLTVIGLISTVSFLNGMVKAFADNTKEKNEFARFIYPIVICDPAPFSQTIQLRNDTMITAAIWDVILYADHSKYAAEFDYIIVPEVDVELHAIRLFGPGMSFNHVSILGADVQFYYDEEIKSYYIPSRPRYFTYSPYIKDISRVGERYTLTVGYIAPTPSWLTLSNDEAPTPEKYVEYVVSRRGSEFTLIAVQESSVRVESDHAP
ncbi:MAG: hypothetical protein FWG90_12820 [Oscillospiraceae bacterium]|nr:hypothetical protein [Oscillospiraceae bacterium]